MIKKYKKNDLTSYTLGTTLTLELLKKQPDKIKMIYIHSNQEKNDTYFKVLEICKNNNIEIIYNDKVFNILSEKENCFMIGVFLKYENSISKSSNHIVLVNPSNTGNLGTIIRTSLGFNIFDIAIIKPAVDIFDPKVIRASMGAIFNINFKYYDNIDDYLGNIDERKIYPFMLDGKSSLSEMEKSKHYSLVFGNESSGLPDIYHNIGESVYINHSNKIDSLNLDNAVSIALYEFTKEDF